ncbi:MAG TPA: aromatic ring-hydroxylating dioxygenase subunit alpha [Caldimonas sp.]|jgi:vanillate O-demethylase monooxygenase subunit
MTFVRNCWYVIAWDHEVPPDALFSRTVLGEAILLYRTEGGAIVALRDRCCHRLAPLSKGRREGDCVRCGYHGLLFDATGRCVEIPGAETVPAKARVQRYPLAVKNKWVFVWMGDPAAADPALLPDNFSCDDAGWDYVPGYLHYATPQQLICDNLLDFSHLSYVHEKTLGGSTAIARARAAIEAVPRGIRVTRKVRDVPPPPYYRAVREIGGHLDRWFIYDFVLPGTLLMHSGGRPTGDREDDMSRAVRLHSCQTVTPETETTSHYFFQQSRRVEDGDHAIAEALHQALLVAFEEDRAMITAQSRSIAADPDAPMLLLAMDAAVVRFRRLVAETIAAEQPDAAAARPARTGPAARAMA